MHLASCVREIKTSPQCYLWNAVELGTLIKSSSLWIHNSDEGPRSGKTGIVLGCCCLACSFSTLARSLGPRDVATEDSMALVQLYALAGLMNRLEAMSFSEERRHLSLSTSGIWGSEHLEGKDGIGERDERNKTSHYAQHAHYPLAPFSP